MDRAEIDRYLAEFDQNPRAVMTRVPPKRDARGRIVQPRTAFEHESIVSGRFVEERDEVRRRTRGVVNGAVVTLDQALSGRAPIGANDRAEDLCDAVRHTKLSDMENAKLTRASLAEVPWTDDYWAVYQGVLGRRYADPGFPGSLDWKENYDYIQENPFLGVLEEGDQEALDRLSPSEKYDLLVGDPRGTMTQTMWDEGKRYFDAKGEVERWMGICHGWAPAAYMLPRPRGEVVVKAADGETDLRFFPSDLKALASLLWANANMPARFIGTRTEDKSPKLDENGRILSQAAFDTNPGTWHVAMVNQIGVSRRSLIIDATYDYEVWNQPVHSYEYHYFNPQTMRFTQSLRDATVARDAFTKDRFKKYRSAGYRSAVGVAMRTRYVVETSPSHDPVEGGGGDALTTVDYFYDVELDEAGAILGGEWYLNRHPDFLWTPAKNTRAVTPADNFASGAWDAPDPLPSSWRSAAIRASGQGLPLAKIVERLLALSNA